MLTESFSLASGRLRRDGAWAQVSAPLDCGGFMCALSSDQSSHGLQYVAKAYEKVSWNAANWSFNPCARTECFHMRRSAFRGKFGKQP